MGHTQDSTMGQTIRVNGATLHYTKSGKGEPLLLLHGWTQSAAFWKPYADRLAVDYEVYAIDMRGHGRSSPLTRDFSVHGEEQIRAMFDPSLDYRINLSEQQMKNLQTKVLIINGDSDEIADIRQAAEMKRLIPQSALWIIPNTGHLAISEANREAFLSIVKNFFEQ